MFMEFFGVCTLSLVSGQMQNVKSVVKLEEVVEVKKDVIVKLLYTLDKLRSDEHIEDEVYVKGTKYIEETYFHNIKTALREDEWWNKFSPKLKNQLVFSVLKPYYNCFSVFFKDLNTGWSADKAFVRKIISNMTLQICLDGSII